MSSVSPRPYSSRYTNFQEIVVSRKDFDGAQDTRRRTPDYQGCCRYAAGRRTRQVFLDNPQRKTLSVHSRTGEILRAATLGTVKGF